MIDVPITPAIFFHFLCTYFLRMFAWVISSESCFFFVPRDWGKRFNRLYPEFTTWDNSKERDRPLTIGYVSPDYFTHSVSYFIEAPLVHHNYTNFRVVVYCAVVKVRICERYQNLEKGSPVFQDMQLL